MIRTPTDIGKAIRETRKAMGITQKDLALTSGTGLRFIIDLEKGKDTCQLGKTLTVLQTLGMKIDLTSPASLQPSFPFDAESGRS
jgi:HTH-type transcriptional regulator / antitoxin HipB